MSLKRLQHAVALNAVLLLLSLGSGTLAQAAPAAQGTFRPKIHYELYLVPLEFRRVYNSNGFKVSLCPGETGWIQVYIDRYVDGRLSDHISSGDVNALYQPGHAVAVSGTYDNFEGSAWSEVKPNFTNISAAGGGLVLGGEAPYAIFEVEALSTPERSDELAFIAYFTDPVFPVQSQRVGADLATIEVKVETCYEATQSALGDEFLEKDICSLERPFALETRHTMSVGGATITNHTHALFFLPRRKNMLEGWYAFVSSQTTIPPDGKPYRGIEFGSGSYSLAMDMSFEGNLTLKSDHTNCFSGDCFPVAITGYKILIKPLPTGSVCEGMLP